MPGADRAIDAHTHTIPPTQNIQRKLQLIVWGSFAVGVAVAVLLGYLLLYLPNRSRGSEVAMLTIFLWALGVLQVAGVAGASSAEALVTKIEAGGGGD